MLTQTKNILFLDALSPIGMFSKFTDSLQTFGHKTHYLDLSKIKKKKFFKSRRLFNSLMRKCTHQKKYFYYPKIDLHELKAIFYKTNPDTVIIAGMFYHYMNKEILSELKKELGFQLFLLETDCGNFLNKRNKTIFFFKQLLPLFDHVFSCSKNMTELMKALGTNHVSFFPFGFQNDFTSSKHEKTHDICFVGMPEMRRIFFLEQLKNHHLSIYGADWKKYKPLLSNQLQTKFISKDIWGDKLNHFLDQTKIIINITTTPWHGLDTSSHLRVLEALAIQGFVLTDYCEELEALFDIGKEIETFHSAEELRRKVSYYLQHNDEREKIAQAGHQKFLERYTWKIRAKAFLNEVETLHLN